MAKDARRNENRAAAGRAGMRGANAGSAGAQAGASGYEFGTELGASSAGQAGERRSRQDGTARQQTPWAWQAGKGDPS